MSERWVCLDVGETLIDETRVWSTWADELGIPRLTFLAALGDVEEIRASFPDPRGKAGGRPVAVVPAAEAERRYSA